MMHAAAHSRGLQLVPEVLRLYRRRFALRPQCEVARAADDGGAGRVDLLVDASGRHGAAGSARPKARPYKFSILIILCIILIYI